MATWMRTLVSRGSVLTACLAIGGAAYSISKNTPRLVSSQPQIQPPTQPGGLSRPDQDAPPARSGFIGGSGLVEPSSELIAIGANVSGVVTQVRVKPGDRIREGEVLFQIDDRSQKADLLQKQAEWQAAKAKLIELKAQIAPAVARVQSASAIVRQTRSRYRRRSGKGSGRPTKSTQSNPIPFRCGGGIG